MQKRWLINLFMLLLIAGLVSFVYLKPKHAIEENPTFEVSTYKLSEFDAIKIDYPAKASVELKKVDGHWRILKPYQTRADRASIFRILSLVAAKSETKIQSSNSANGLSQDDLEKYGLVTPKVKLNLLRPDGSKAVFLFGTFNPITDEQYIAHNNAVYLLPVNYVEAVTIQTIEMVDKSPLKPQERIAGMDLSHLEQWQESRLKIEREGGNWLASLTGAKLDQLAMQEWFDYNWKDTAAESVALYTPKQHEHFPYVVITMEGGQKVRFDKRQESPKLLLGRPDEGIIYTFPADAGFAMLNPPISVPTAEE